MLADIVSGTVPGVAMTFHSPRTTWPLVPPHVESMRSCAKRAGIGSGSTKDWSVVSGDSSAVSTSCHVEPSSDSSKRDRLGAGQDRLPPTERIEDHARDRDRRVTCEVDGDRQRGCRSWSWRSRCPRA